MNRTSCPCFVTGLLLLTALFPINSLARATQKPAGKPENSDAAPVQNDQGPAKPNGPLIDIKIETSRSQPTAGTGLGIIAEITNISQTPVYLHDQHVTLSLPIEIEDPSGGVHGRWGLFPTIPTDGWGRQIALKPGDSYKVLWAQTRSSSKGGQPDQPQASTIFGVVRNVFDEVCSELQFMFFSPGDYKITVVAQYWTDPKKVEQDDYHAITQSATLHVAAPQFVILLGAAIGGLFAYLIIPEIRRRWIRVPNNARTLLIVRRQTAGILLSMALSAIVTILLSRISETQFLIRVTVNDFWGAIAIGFIANYAGARLIAKIVHGNNSGYKPSESKEDDKPPESSAGGQVEGDGGGLHTPQRSTEETKPELPSENES